MTDLNPINVTTNAVTGTTAKKAENVAKEAVKEAAQMTEMPSVSLGRDLVTKPIFIKAGEDYAGKVFDVQALGSAPIEVEEVTAENVGKYRKHIDIWYQGGAEKNMIRFQLNISNIEMALMLWFIH